jgi:ferric-dicitrate binding protein FerR (iron transport regulator)
MNYFAELKTLLTAIYMPSEGGESPEETNVLNRIKTRSSARRQWAKIAKWSAVAALFVLGIVNAYYIGYHTVASRNEQRILLTHTPEAYKHEIYTDNGVKASITLPDSSLVLLNSGTRIVFPDRFTGSTREVYLSGEAYFNVKSDSLRPMIITTPRNFHVEVKGTTFNIRSYENEADAQTTLISGRLDIVYTTARNKEVTRTLKPQESFILSNHTLSADRKSDAVYNEVAWKDGVLIFEKTPMRDIITKLTRWHGTEFTVIDPEILNYRITATFKSESIIQIMEMIKFTSFIDYRADGNHITLRKKIRTSRN